MGFSSKESKALVPRKLSKDFAKNISLLGLEERPQQLEFVEKIEQLLEEYRHPLSKLKTGLARLISLSPPCFELGESSRYPSECSDQNSSKSNHAEEGPTPKRGLPSGNS